MSFPVWGADLVPTDDSYVRGGGINARTTGIGSLLVVKNSVNVTEDRWSYLKFDLGGIAGSVTKATLALSVNSAAGTTTINVNGTTDDWTETGIVWSNKPAQGALIRSFSVSRPGDVVIDVTDYVKAQASGDAQASFVLSAPVADGHYVSIASSESSQSPVLVVDTTAQPPSDWTFCSDENQVCTLPGQIYETRQLRFGAGNNYVVKTIYQPNFYGNRINCQTGTFGVDPAPGQNKHCDYGPVLYRSLPAPSNPMGPAIDLNAIPVGDPGVSAQMIGPTTELPVPSDIGAFRTVCNFSHMNFDDPIVYPGQPGKSHLHTYFGNTGANAWSTQRMIAGSGNSTCRGGTANRSAYWVPSLIDTRTHKPLPPISNVIYYKTGYLVPSALIKPMPAGLRIIAGDMRASSQQPILVGWWCSDVSYPISGAIPPSCAAGKDLVMTLSFPQCWDGKNLDSADHKSHMAYASNDYATASKCPATHPVPLPEIAYNVHYLMKDDTTSNYLRLSSDMYSTSIPGGYSAHGDWFNGWNSAIEEAWVKNCDNASVDCHGHLLGDGRELLGPP